MSNIFFLKEKKVDLKEHLVCDYEEKKKNIDNERVSMDLMSGLYISVIIPLKIFSKFNI